MGSKSKDGRIEAGSSSAPPPPSPPPASRPPPLPPTPLPRRTTTAATSPSRAVSVKDHGSEDEEQQRVCVPRRGCKLSSIRKFLKQLLRHRRTPQPPKDSKNEPCEKVKDVGIPPKDRNNEPCEKLEGAIIQPKDNKNEPCEKLHDAVLLPKDGDVNSDSKNEPCKKGKNVVIPRRRRFLHGKLPLRVTMGHKTLGRKKLSLALVDDFHEAENHIIQQKIKLLSEKYAFFRQVSGDGNCFYRGFIFNYMERIVEIQDEFERKLEVARLMRCVEKSKEAYLSLGRHEAYFSYLFVVFEDLVKLIANGLTAEDLYQMNLKKCISSRILRFVRLLTEIEICMREDFYKPFFPQPTISDEEVYASASEFCMFEVRCKNSEASQPQIVALVNALGIPLTVENLDTSLASGAVTNPDTSLPSGVVRLNQHDFIPEPESEVDLMLGHLNPCKSVSSESTSSVESFSSGSSYHTAIGTTMEHLDQPSTSGSGTNNGSTPSEGNSGEQTGTRTIANLTPAERGRLVTLLYRPGHYDILYPK